MIKIYVLAAVACFLILSGCFKPDEYDRTNANGLISFASKDQTVLADGVNTAEIKVLVNEDSDIPRRRVVFRTTFGGFKNGNADSVVVEADSDRYATAYLTSVRVGEAVVTAFIQNLKLGESQKVTFTRAFPESISVLVDSFSIRPVFTSEVLITATLNRDNNGRASAGHPVTFTVRDGFGNDIGTFLNNQNVSTTNADGKAIIRYSAGPTTFRGYLTISATASKSDGSLLNPATTRIFLND